MVDIVNEKPDYRSEIMKQLNTKISKNVSGTVFKPILHAKLESILNLMPLVQWFGIFCGL